MPDYLEADLAYAREIIDSLLAYEQRDIELRNGLAISDIENDADDFKNDLDILSDFGLDVPAVRIENETLIPVALSYFDLGPYNKRLLRYPKRWRNDQFSEIYYYFIRDLLYSLSENRNENEFTTISRETARSTFRERAVDFLASRIFALRNLGSNGNPPPDTPFLNIFRRKKGSKTLTPGCLFSVTTNSKGLRVFWSGAYRLTASYFGYPTTPATSVLQSGRYVFGVDGGAYGSDIQWDFNAVIDLPISPGNSPSLHLNY